MLKYLFCLQAPSGRVWGPFLCLLSDEAAPGVTIQQCLSVFRGGEKASSFAYASLN